MKTILNQMGIQQWRLRPKPKNTVLPSEFTEPDINQASIDTAGVKVGIDKPSSFPDHVEKQTVADKHDDVSSVVSVVDEAAAIDSAPQGADMRDSRVPTPRPMAMPAPISNPITTATPLATTTHEQANLGLDPFGSLDWQGLQQLVDGQRQCPTCGVSNSNLGVGDANANWLFVSDAPTPTDLALNQLFSGRAGQLYEAMLSAVGLNRASVYTTSIFKCVASGDLTARPCCDKLLDRQIELLKPKVIISLGEFASQSVAKSNESLESLRVQDLICHRSKTPIVASYSPLRLLEEPLLKAKAWEDLKKCIAISR